MSCRPAAALSTIMRCMATSCFARMRMTRAVVRARSARNRAWFAVTQSARRHVPKPVRILDRDRASLVDGAVLGRVLAVRWHGRPFLSGQSNRPGNIHTMASGVIFIGESGEGPACVILEHSDPRKLRYPGGH